MQHFTFVILPYGWVGQFLSVRLMSWGHYFVQVVCMRNIYAQLCILEGSCPYRASLLDLQSQTC